MKYKAFFQTYLPALITVVVFAIPQLVTAAGPTVRVETDTNTIDIVAADGYTTHTIEYGSKTDDFQAVRLKKDDVYYVAVLHWVKQKIRFELYNTEGKKLSNRLVHEAKNGKSISVIRLEPIEVKNIKYLQVRYIINNANGTPSKLFRKRYKAKVTNSSPFTLQSTKKKIVAYPDVNGLSNTTAGLVYLNYERMAAGLLPVSYKKSLNKGCELHAEYMRLNEEMIHYEDESKAGYTEEGANAGTQSNLATQTIDSMRNAIDLWSEAIYHRMPMMRNNLRKIGWAISDAASDGYRYACLDVWGGHEYSALEYYGEKNFETYYNPDNHEPIPFPGIGQQQVTRIFDSGEIPDPIQAFDGTYPVGYPISLGFSDDDTVTKMTMKLFDPSGKEVPGYFRAPNDDTDPNELYQGNHVTLIPKAELAASTTYTVQVTGKRNGEDYSKNWNFITE